MPEKDKTMEKLYALYILVINFMTAIEDVETDLAKARNDLREFLLDPKRQRELCVLSMSREVRNIEIAQRLANLVLTPFVRTIRNELAHIGVSTDYTMSIDELGSTDEKGLVVGIDLTGCGDDLSTYIEHRLSQPHLRDEAGPHNLMRVENLRNHARAVADAVEEARAALGID